MQRKKKWRNGIRDLSFGELGVTMTGTAWKTNQCCTSTGVLTSTTSTASMLFDVIFFNVILLIWKMQRCCGYQYLS